MLFFASNAAMVAKKRRDAWRYGRTSGLALAACLLCTAEAKAQENRPDTLQEAGIANGADISVGDIIVTARRVSERAQDIPASVVAVNAAASARLGTLADIQSQVSGVTFQNFGPQAVIGIRGFGNRLTFTGANSTVGIFQDGVYVSPGLVSLLSRLDLDRIEVAKGPQSTLYGRSSFTGAINAVTADPSHDLSGYVDVGHGGSSVSGDSIWRARTALSGPISGALSARVYLLREKRDGFAYDRTTGFRGGGWDRKIAQAKLMWEPSPLMTARLSGMIVSDNAPRADFTQLSLLAPLGQRVLFGNPLNPAVQPTPSKTVWDANFAFPQEGQIRGQTATLDLRFQMPLGELASLSNYQHSSQKIINESDYGKTPLVRAGIYFDDVRYSEELRLSGKSARFNYLVGVYLLHSKFKLNKGNLDLDAPLTTFFPGSAGYDLLRASRLYQPGYTTTDAYAAFGQLAYDITNRLTLTLGLRQGHEHQSGTTAQYFLLQTGVVQTLQSTAYRSASFNATTGSAILGFKLAPDVLTYASFSRGDSPGGFNSGVGPVVYVVYQPQKVDAYEIGLKSKLLGGRIRLNIALFDNEYSDLQLTRLSNVTGGAPVSLTTNAGSSYGRGVDLDAVAALTRDLQFSVRYTYSKSRITNYRVPLPPAPQVDFTGAPLVHSPLHSLNASVTYSHSIGAGKFNLTAEEAYVSSSTNDYQGAPAGTVYPGRPGVPAGVTSAQVLALYRSPGYALTNINVSYALNGWQLGFDVRNLLNHQYIASAASQDALTTPVQLPGAPRTWEVSLKYSF